MQATNPWRDFLRYDGRMRSTATLAGILQVEGLGPDHKVDLSVETVAQGVELVRARFRFANRSPAEPVTLAWYLPARDVHGHWAPIAGQRRGNDADWDIRYEARSNAGAPIHCLHGYGGRNRLTFAVSDTYGPVQLKAGLATGEGVFRCAVVLVEPPSAPTYEIALRLDVRDIPFSSCIEDVRRWWEAMPEHTSLPPHPLARLPVYSTWYGFFRDFDAHRVEEECRIAHDLGCATIAVDDGWQTDDRGLECAHCGPWTVARGKIEDMRAHVARVHAIGMKYLLWYSLPHMSSASPDFRRFEGKYLDYDPRSDLWTVDPRYPDVREYLTERLVRALREWDLDGFRLDFIDGIRSTAASTTHSTAPGRDADSLYVSIDRLLSDIGTHVRSIKPDALLELRHASIGPIMRKHALILRGAECPQDSLMNRLNVLDMRLLAGQTAVHSDMLTWTHDEPVESAALQFVNALFAVPQLSVRLGALPRVTSRWSDST